VKITQNHNALGTYLFFTHHLFINTYYNQATTFLFFCCCIFLGGLYLLATLSIESVGDARICMVFFEIVIVFNSSRSGVVDLAWIC